MPPQPLRSVRPNARTVGDPDALRSHPALASQIGEAVAIWARTESTLGIMLAFMLKAGIRASVAMYSSILNSRAQMDALEAAARVSLTPDDLELFGAVITLVKRARAKRDKLAHWLWGHSPDIPNALLLFDPDAVLEFSTSTVEFMRAVLSGDFSRQRAKLDRSRVFVYREKDLAEIVSELSAADELSKQFTALVFEPSAPGAAQLRNQLLGEPRIQEVLSRNRAPRQSAP